jgi:hypothetical protein
MKLVGLLSFYDEPVPTLLTCIASLAEHGVDELVAVDGAYALYPGGRARSHPDQHAAIVLACREVGMSCTLHTPRTVWRGNEVEKRTFMFDLAWATARDGDWFWVMDADQVVLETPEDFKERLANTDMLVGAVTFKDTVAERINQRDMPTRFSVRDLFRAQKITVETNHCTYVAGDGKLLWGGNGDVVQERLGHPLEPCLDLMDDVLVEHRPDHRPDDRLRGKLAYYRARDEQKVERGECSQCGQRADRLVPIRWRMTEIGPVGDWTEACDGCAPLLDRVARAELVRIGVDPDSVTPENRNGHPPERVPAAGL